VRARLQLREHHRRAHAALVIQITWSGYVADALGKLLTARRQQFDAMREQQQQQSTMREQERARAQAVHAESSMRSASAADGGCGLADQRTAATSAMRAPVAAPPPPLQAVAYAQVSSGVGVASAVPATASQAPVVPTSLAATCAEAPSMNEPAPGPAMRASVAPAAPAAAARSDAAAARTEASEATEAATAAVDVSAGDGASRSASPDVATRRGSERPTGGGAAGGSAYGSLMRPEDDESDGGESGEEEEEEAEEEEEEEAEAEAAASLLAEVLGRRPRADADMFKGRPAAGAAACDESLAVTPLVQPVPVFDESSSPYKLGEYY
jgi:hypothetical protein